MVYLVHPTGIRTFNPWIYLVHQDFLTSMISGFHQGGPGSTPAREYILVTIFRDSERQGFILGASQSSYRAKGVEGFRLVTAQELFSKCIYLGFEIPQEQVSICFGFLSATAFLKASNQVCGMPTSKDIDDGRVAT